MKQPGDRSRAPSLATAIADYAGSHPVNDLAAIDRVRHCLIDALGQGFDALRDPDRASLVGPLVPGALMPGGARIPGTSLELDPAQAAFCLGAMFCPGQRWDPGPDASEQASEQTSGQAIEPPHPYGAAAVLAALLATADYRARKATMEGASPPKVRDVLAATVKALQVQEVLSKQSGFNPAGSVALRYVCIAVTAMAAAQLGGNQVEIVNAIGYACADAGGSFTAASYDPGHESWATADAISRAVRHACQAVASRHGAPASPVEASSTELAGMGMPPGAAPSAARQPFDTGGTAARAAMQERPRDTEPARMRLRAAIDRHFPSRQAERIKLLFAAPERLDDLPVNELLAALVTNGAS